MAVRQKQDTYHYFRVAIDAIKTDAAEFLVVFSSQLLTGRIRHSKPRLNRHKCHALVCTWRQVHLMDEVFLVVFQVNVGLVPHVTWGKTEWNKRIRLLFVLHEGLESYLFYFLLITLWHWLLRKLHLVFGVYRYNDVFKTSWRYDLVFNRPLFINTIILSQCLLP